MDYYANNTAIHCKSMYYYVFGIFQRRDDTVASCEMGDINKA
jgi:hypothetical protein